MTRVLVLIDGFNFYHCLKSFQKQFNVCVKWLDYKSLMLKCFNDPKDADNVYEFIYFSAFAKHRGQDCVERHRTYISALKTQNIKFVLGNFKDKDVPRCSRIERCKNCTVLPEKNCLKRHEEKNTDVNIAITLIEKAMLKAYDKCYILSSDSDFYSAIERARIIYPEGKIVLVPAPLIKNASRKKYYFLNNAMKLTGTHPLFISWSKIKKSQFPDIISNSIKNPWAIS